MADLKPVDYDPFAGHEVTPVDGDPFANVTVTPVDGDPFAGVKATPVDHDPFGPTDTWTQLGTKVAKRAIPLLEQGVAGTAQAIAEHPSAAATQLVPIVPSVATAADYLLNRAKNWLGEKMGLEPDQSAKITAEVYKNTAADLQENQPNVEEGSLKDYAAMGAESLIQMIPGIAAGLATRSPAVGAAAMAIPVAGQRYGQSRAEDRTPEQARQDFEVTALAEGIPEMLPLGVIMKPGGKFLMKTLKAMGLGSLSESLTQIVEDGYSAGVLDEGMTWEQAKTNLKKAAILGGITEGVAGAALHPFLKETAETPPPSDRGALSPPAPPPESAANAPAATAATPMAVGPSAEPSAPAAGAPSLPDLVEKRVGLRREGGPPEPVLVEAVQDGYVFYRLPDGSQRAATEGEFRRDLTAAPPPSDPNKGDATTVPAPIRESGTIPDASDSAINDFDPNEVQQRPVKAPPPPSPQQAMPLPATEKIADLRRAASTWQQNAAEAERIGQKTPQEIASMRVEAARLMDEAAELQKNLTPARVSQDVTAATPEQMAARKLGALGTAAPETSEAVTGPREYPVRATPAPTPPQMELAPVSQSEAENPQPLGQQPIKESVPWQQRLSQEIGAKKAKIGDVPALAQRLGATEPEVTSELNRIASGKNAPIRLVRGQVKIDKKTKQPVQSKYAGRFMYAAKPAEGATESLSDFVYGKGGITPTGSFAGELAARDLHKAKRQFVGKLVRENGGMNTEQMADAAMAEGFMIKPDATGQHADVDDFLNKLARDHSGSPIYRPGEEPASIDDRVEAYVQTPAEDTDELDFLNDQLGMEKAVADSASQRVQDAARQEAGDDYPDEWYAQEIAEGAPAAQPEAPAGVPESGEQVGPEPAGEGRGEAAGEPAAEAAPAPRAESEPRPPVKTELTPEGEQPVLLDVPKSAVQLQKAREAKFKGRAGTDVAQRAPGGMFDEVEPDNQTDLGDFLSQPTSEGRRVGEPRSYTKGLNEAMAGQSPAERAQTATDWILERGRETGHEYGAILTRVGKLIWAGTSDLQHGLSFSPDVLAALMDATLPIDLHHNHPNSGPLSTQDMGVLGYPGARWVIAHGHNGAFSAAKLSDGYIAVMGRYKPDDRTALLNWAINNAHAASHVLHRPIHEAGKLPDALPVYDAGWRALHEAGIIDYRSSMAVPDYSVPIIGDIRDQITKRLKDNGIDLPTADRVHRPAVTTGTAEGLAEVSGRPGKDEAARPVREPATPGSAQGRLFEEGGEGLRTPGESVPEPETGSVLSRLIADESGALTLPDWDKVRAAIGKLRGKRSATAIAAAGNAIRLGSPNSLRRFASIGRYAQNAAWLASQDQRSAAYYNAMLNQEHTKNKLQQQAFEKMAPYARLSDKDRATVNAMLEYYRLYGETPEKTGRMLVVKVPDRPPPFGTARPTLSKPGQILAASKEMTSAIHSLVDMFGDTWTSLHEAMAREGGYTGEFKEGAIQSAIDGANSTRSRRAAELAMRIWQSMNQTKREGYAVPMQRYGDTFISVTPKAPAESEGIPKPVHFEFNDTRSFFRDPFRSVRGGGSHPTVEQRMAELRKQFPADKFDIGTGPVEPKAMQSIDIPEIERALALMNNATDKKYAQAVDALLAKMYQERKAGPRKPARSVAGYSTDFERAITDYVMQMSSVISKMAHRDDVNSAFEGTQEHGDKAIRDYWEHYREYMEKDGGDLQGLRKMGFFMMMWGNPSSAALDLTQTPLITQFQLASWAGARAPGLAHGAMMEAVLAVRASKGQGLMIDLSKVGKTDTERALIKEAADEGRLGPQISKEFQGGDISRRFPKSRPHLKRFTTLWNWGASMKNVAEEINRIAALLAAHRAAQNPQLLAKAAQVYKDDQLFQQQVGKNATPEKLAKFFLDDTQFVAGKINRAPAMRGVGGLVFQFKNYPLNYLRLLHKNFTRMGPEGKIVGGMMLAGLALAAGALGAPFAEDALKAEEWVQQKITGIDPMWEHRFRKWLTGGEDEGFKQFAADVILHGVGHNILGADMGDRIGMGQLFPSDSLSDTVPLLSAIYSRGNEVIERGSRGQPLGALAAASSFVGGKAGYDWMRAFAQYSEGIKTQYGSPIVKPEDVTLGELGLRAVGVQPTAVTRAQERAYTDKRIAGATTDAKNRETTRLAQLIVDIQDANKAGNTKKASEISKQFNELVAKDAALFADPDTPMWQKMTPVKREALRRRVLSIIQPEIARIKGAPKTARQEILENQSGQ